MIVPFAGGSASDVVTRIMLTRMSQSMGQPLVIENRPGAGGNIGTALGAKAAPDGYTWIASGSGPIAANKTLYRDLGYDPETDFEAVSPFAFGPGTQFLIAPPTHLFCAVFAAPFSTR